MLTECTWHAREGSKGGNPGDEPPKLTSFGVLGGDGGLALGTNKFQLFVLFILRVHLLIGFKGGPKGQPPFVLFFGVTLKKRHPFRWPMSPLRS